MATLVRYIARQTTEALSYIQAVSLLREGARFAWCNGKGISAENVLELYKMKARIGGYCYYRAIEWVEEDLKTAEEARRQYNETHASGWNVRAYRGPRMCKVLELRAM